MPTPVAQTAPQAEAPDQEVEPFRPDARPPSPAAAGEMAVDPRDEPGREGVARARRIDDADGEGREAQRRAGNGGHDALPSQRDEDARGPQPAQGRRGPGGFALADERGRLVRVAVEDVDLRQGPAEESPGLCGRG